MTPLVLRLLSTADTIEPELRPDKGIDLLCAKRDTGLVPGHSWVSPNHLRRLIKKNALHRSLLSVYKLLNLQMDSLSVDLLIFVVVVFLPFVS